MRDHLGEAKMLTHQALALFGHEELLGRYAPRVLTGVADEVAHLPHRLFAANPPDGKVRLIEAENGSLIAEWTSQGEPASVGPTTTRQLP